jgi:Co/Zn/Cd efflux system component
MEGAPRHIDYSTVLAALQSLDGVRLAHSLHLWSLSLSQTAATAHLAVGELTRNVKFFWSVGMF